MARLPAPCASAAAPRAALARFLFGATAAGAALAVAAASTGAAEALVDEAAAAASFAAAAAVGAADDDECRSEDGEEACSLNALQLRAGAVSSGTAGADRSTTGRRRREAPLTATPVYDGPDQPDTCGEEAVKKGYEGCCVNSTYKFNGEGCCGSLVYKTASQGCCIHSDKTATIYDPMKYNCCDDLWRENTNSGLCRLSTGETSCCELADAHRRRRRRRRGTASLLRQEPSESGEEAEDEEEVGEGEGQ